MKKLLAMLLTALCVGSLAVVANADVAEPTNRSIPKAATAPTIDGVITGDEWDNALTVTINKDNTNAVIGSGECPDSVIKWMWDEKGLYFYAEVNDTTESGVVHSQGEGSYNSGDGVQFCIYPDPTMSGNELGTLYFWSIVVCDDGTAAIGEHFTFGDGGSGADVPDAKAACTKNGNAYTIEAFMPCVCWESSSPAIDVVDGTTFAMTHTIMEHDGLDQSLFADSGWFSGPDSNTYTLTNDVAGHVDAPETTVDETVTTDEPSAPQTFDVAVIAAVAAIVSAAGYAVSKKH